MKVISETKNRVSVSMTAEELDAIQQIVVAIVDHAVSREADFIASFPSEERKDARADFNLAMTLRTNLNKAVNKWKIPQGLKL